MLCEGSVRLQRNAAVGAMTDKWTPCNCPTCGNETPVDRESNDDPGHVRKAAELVALGIEIRRNEYGTFVSVHHCAACGREFTICPPSSTYGDDCILPECASYDPSRDADVFFGGHQ